MGGDQGVGGGWPSSPRARLPSTRGAARGQRGALQIGRIGNGARKAARARPARGESCVAPTPPPLCWQGRHSIYPCGRWVCPPNIDFFFFFFGLVWPRACRTHALAADAAPHRGRQPIEKWCPSERAAQCPRVARSRLAGGRGGGCGPPFFFLTRGPIKQPCSSGPAVAMAARRM